MSEWIERVTLWDEIDLLPRPFDLSFLSLASASFAA